MVPVQELKIRAEILHRRLRTLDPGSLARLRALAELRRATGAELALAAPSLQRKHCLTVVSRELGFSGYEHARRVLDGDPEVVDFGKLLYRHPWSAHLNIWFAHHDEACGVLAQLAPEPRRYLLAYQRHCFITDGPFIEALGLDPADPDWEAIGWDWVRPRDRAARGSLYRKAIAALGCP